MEEQKSLNSTLIIILGIVSIIGCCCYGIVGLIAGIIALGLASRAKALYLKAPETYTGYQNVKTGRILAIIGISLSVIYLILIVILISLFGLEALQEPEALKELLEEKYGVN